GLTHERVPAALEAACQQRGVNLFEVPAATTFVAVSRSVVHRLEAAEQAATREALDVQRRLVQAALREDDTRAILSRTAEAAGGAARTVLADGRNEHGPVGTRPELVSLERCVEEVRRLRPRGVRAAASTTVPGGTMLVQPVGLSPRPSRYVAVGFPGRVSDQQRLAVATAVALLGLADERRRAGRETDRALRSRAVELLLRGESRGATLLLEARPDAAPVRVPTRAVVLRATGPADVLHDALATVEESEVLAALVGEELVCVVRPGLASRVGDRLAAEGSRVGVGEQVPLEELRRSHATAGYALATGGAAQPVVHWESVVGRGVSSLIEPPRAAAFAESLLGRLRGPLEQELLETLSSFLRHHGAQAAVARELGLHRNTVRHRLAAVEEALGRSLDDPQTRVDCWVALQAVQGA
ncbi:MAG: PucR family transcriptional regulator, partial [Nocardioidaceae bacterium]